MPSISPASSTTDVDVLVVGGGINGAGIARDLAGRGLRVLLVERDDLASHTSSCSTKLIHGGLRYLEQYRFALVRKALAERELLLRAMPHLAWPLRFVMPQQPAMRPAWMVRAGLLLYDHLARRSWLPASRALDLRRDVAGAALQPQYTRGFSYADGWVDDARLVLACAQDAVERGATVHTRCACVHVARDAAGWQAMLRHGDGREQRVQARALVNAAGPWAAQFLATIVRDEAGLPLREHAQLRLVRGSHIVLPRQFSHNDAYLFQASDRRVIFALPYERDFTLIGTTDVEVDTLAKGNVVSAAEVEYLCREVNAFLRTPVHAGQMLWCYAGVRPLLEDAVADPAAATREYRLELNQPQAAAPLLNVWGGKLTTFRVLAAEAGDLLCHALGEPRAAWTHAALLPGGDLGSWVGTAQTPPADFSRFLQALAANYPWLPTALRERWARAYGSRLPLLLRAPHAQPAGGDEAQSLAELGAEIAPGLHVAELRYLQQMEWARSADDVLWRRSKLGLHYSATQRAAVADWFAAAASAAGMREANGVGAEP